MKTVLNSALAATVAFSLAALSATGAFAKAHDQGQTDDPGANVGAETAGPAQGLGGALGNGQGPADTPAGANPGKSEDAGRDNGGPGASATGRSGGSER